MADDKKNSKEASNIFHSIMKASVTPPKKIDEKKEVKPKPKTNGSEEKGN
jgi:hypothetical protein